MHKKRKFSIKDFFSKCDQIRKETADLVTFTEKFLHGKLSFFVQWFMFQIVYSSLNVWLWYWKPSTAKNTVISPDFLVRKLCLSTKFPHQEIRWNYSIFRSEVQHPIIFKIKNSLTRIGVSKQDAHCFYPFSNFSKTFRKFCRFEEQLTGS